MESEFEMNIRVATLTLLLALNLVTALVLESTMGAASSAELVYILIALIVSVGVLFGAWARADWAYGLGTILFSANLANMLWVFYNTKMFLAFAFGVLVNISGLVLCILSARESVRIGYLETYAEEKPKKRSTKKRARKRSTKKRAAKRRSTKKRVKKRAKKRRTKKRTAKRRRR